MALYARHPRFTVALLILIFISLVMFASDSAPFSSVRSMAFSKSRDAALAEVFALEETHYEEIVQRRQQLIKKWGPTPDKVDPFPSHGEFYTLWDFFLPSFRCPHRVERIGIMGDGGKWVCGLERIAPKRECNIYSFGVNGESSFEADLMKAAPGCQIYGYDFSVRSFGPEIEQDMDLKSRSHFFSYALGPEDKHSAADNPKMFTLRTLMDRNGHDFIDILKVDIEGNEFDSLSTFIDSFHGEPLPFGQLQLEVHVYPGSAWNDFPKFLGWWEKLEAAGLRPFFSEPNLVYVNLVRGVRPDLVEYSFINVRGDHELVSNRPPSPRSG
ncbi:methyltransferase domain-containing protein [Suillus fuscotomentosus]|uniref:Methyltransferase domain-containing protein n=1 Tax=Suillus fuscotomentosus TaxID=1912939 RepID=A0AAD4E9S8_9AGAM|nr:methyltransferase domain-containing protein [Suillus fuscotomentosus]KAG1901981.1 methyltransferase domain-containing protein [Suillus fuscotomentosus]